MKLTFKSTFFVSVFAIICLLSACSSNQTLELERVTVDLQNNEGRSGGTEGTEEDKGDDRVVPIALSYDIVLKNTGKKTIGGVEQPNEKTFEYEDGIVVHIEPNKNLKEMSEEIIGFNLYDEDQNVFGIVQTGLPLLESNQLGKYTFDFMLGATEENPEMKLAPPEEKLEKLKEQAMDATLIVTVEGDRKSVV